MKKKTTCLIVTGMLCGMLAACGNKDDAGAGSTTAAVQNNGSPTSVVAESNSAESEGFQWELRTLEQPKMQELELQERTTGDGSAYEVAVTPFAYDIQQIKEILSGNSFITDRYILALERTERGETTTRLTFREGDLVRGSYQEKAGKNKYFQDFYLGFWQDRMDFGNYDTIEFYFDDLEKTDTLQENIAQVIRETLGEEYAEYLVYAKDSDGLGESDTSIDETSLYELVEKDTVVYYLSRTVLEDKDNVTLYFRIGVEENLVTNSGSNSYGNDMIRLADELKYKPEDVTSGVFAAADLIDLDTYPNKYMDLVLFDTERTVLDLSQINTLASDNGIIGNKFELQFLSSNKDLSLLASPEHKISYRIYEDQDGIFFIELEAEGMSGRIDTYKNDADECYTKLVENAKQQALMVLPDLSLEDISYAAMQAANEESLEKEIEYPLFGVTMKGKITFEVGVNSAGCYVGTFHIKLSND
ncbi:MAG: hypothetical protein J1E64_01410 [Acetatifactor sp.]|nr:hypothetical protein [Acetatifactor sp.]